VWALTPIDHARALRPGTQLDAVGDLGDLAVLAFAAVLIKRGNPSIGGEREDRRADRLGQLVADREPNFCLAAGVDQAVRGAGRIGAHEDLHLLDVFGGDLLERSVEHRDVVSRRRSRVAGDRRVPSRVLSA
jgi:hypothetical protein